MIDLAAIRASTDIVTLIALTVRLTRRGKEWLGQCPFHQEKTSSFTVSEAKRFFHCFGCGAHGDALDWIMRTEGATLRQAAARLGGADADDETKERLRRQAAEQDRKRQIEVARDRAIAAYRDRNPDCVCPDWLIDTGGER